MMRNCLIIICLSLVTVGHLSAQNFQLVAEDEYSQACTENQKFLENENILMKKNGLLTIKAKKGKIKFRDYLVEQEDPEMKMYEAMGVNSELCLALIEEIGLVDSKFLLINLNSKKVTRLNAPPLISPDGKYLISISQPEGDNYNGIEIFKLEGEAYQPLYKDDSNSYYFEQRSGKWCNQKFYVKKLDLRKPGENIFVIFFN
jgi:hypothetical protein